MLRLPVILLAILFCGLGMTACSSDRHQADGYIEGRFTYVSSQTYGVLKEIKVNQGDRVKVNDLLFILEPEPQSSELKQAEALYQKAESDLADLLTGKRPTEIAALEAQLRQVLAQLDYAEKTVTRYEYLVKKGVLEQAQLDQTQAERNQLKAQSREMSENIKTAKLEARKDEIEAAKANVQSAKAQWDQMKWQFSQKQIFSPLQGLVFDVFYRAGEVVEANHAVLSLLDPQNVYAIFFVPEQELASLKLNQKIRILCDGLKEPFVAFISFISPQAEFTPPVIYSEKTRASLVYHIEAKFSDINAMKLHPGQPIVVDYNHVKESGSPPVRE